MIYLDNAATTYPKPECVYDFADKFYREYGVYHSRGSYNAAKKTDDLIEETRELLLSLFNAKGNYQTIFSPSATYAINTFINGFSFKDGMNIYISEFEHNAVIRTLENLKNKLNINIHKLTVNKNNLCYNMDEVSSQFMSQTPDIIIINHASNVCGLVSPVSEIFSLGKKYNSINVLDASQTAGMLEIDIKKLNVDCIVFSGHKSLYAPFGIAGMIINESIKLQPLVYGGTGEDSSNINMPEFYPSRLEAGSIDIYALAGLNAALKWVKKIEIKNICLKEKSLLDYTLHKLKQLNNVKCYVFSGEQIPVLSFNVKGYSSDEISEILSKNDIAVRSGLHCAPDAHKLIGTFPTGTVRIGLSYFNCENDIDKLIEVISCV